MSTPAPPPSIDPDSDIEGTLPEQAAQSSAITSFKAPLPAWTSLPERGINMLSQYFSGHSLTHWAHKALLTQMTMGAATNSQELEDKAGQLSEAFGGEANTGKVAAAMLDEATRMGASLGTSPLTYLMPASKALGLFLIPGALQGMGQDIAAVGKHLEATGGKITPDVARHMIRGIAATVSGLSLSAALGSSFEFPRGPERAARVGPPPKINWMGTSEGTPEPSAQAAAEPAPGTPQPPPSTDIESLVGSPSSIPEAIPGSPGVQAANPAAAPVAATPKQAAYEKIADKVEQRSLERVASGDTEIDDHLAKHMLTTHGGILLDNIRNFATRGGKDFWENEVRGNPGLDQNPFRRAFREAYLAPENEATAPGPRMKYSPGEVLKDIPGVAEKLKDINERLAPTATKVTDSDVVREPRFIHSGMFNSVFDLGTITKGPHAGENAVLRVSAEKPGPWPKSKYIAKLYETHQTPEGIRMDVAQKVRSPEEQEAISGQAPDLGADFVKLRRNIVNEGKYDPSDVVYGTPAGGTHPIAHNYAYNAQGEPIVVDPGALIPNKIRQGAERALQWGGMFGRRGRLPNAAQRDAALYKYYTYLARGMGPLLAARAVGSMAPPAQEEEQEQ